MGVLPIYLDQDKVKPISCYLNPTPRTKTLRDLNQSRPPNPPRRSKTGLYGPLISLAL